MVWLAHISVKKNLHLIMIIILQVGSFTVALCAREMKKPFYVLTESFKFSRLYPLNQSDLPNEFKVF